MDRHETRDWRDQMSTAKSLFSVRYNLPFHKKTFLHTIIFPRTANILKVINNQLTRRQPFFDVALSIIILAVLAMPTISHAASQSIGHSTIQKIAVGAYHTVVIKSDGTLWAWGDNTYGQLGDGTLITRGKPEKIGTDTDWVSVAAGASHTVAVKSNGTLWAWGNNSDGQLGDGTTTQRKIPYQITSAGDGWTTVTAGADHTVALKSDGTLWAWGSNDYGKLGDGSTTQSKGPVQVKSSGNGWISVAAGRNHTVAVKVDGTLWAWGSNEYGNIGTGASDTSSHATPVQVAGTAWTAVAAGDLHTVAMKTSGRLYAWGNNTSGQVGDGTTVQKNSPLLISSAGYDWVAIAAGRSHTLAVKVDGTLYAWGGNSYGQLGDGLNATRTAPYQIGTDYKWVGIAAGAMANHSVALKVNGMIWAWGDNNAGQIGDGTSASRNSPAKITWRGNKWLSLAGGRDHTAGIKSDGTLWAWGRNNYGQIGDRSQVNKVLPVKIGDNRWLALEAGSNHTVGIKSDGTLWAWGYNYYGQLGNGEHGSGYYETEPVLIAQGATCKAIDAGINHTVGIKSDGTLWAWGENGYGAIGDGTTTDRYLPVNIDAFTTWRAVASGVYHTAAIKSDGTLWTWGRDNYGQLGDGTTEDKTAPTQVGTASDTWISVATGGYHTAGIKSNGTLWAWGYNAFGQIGDGSTTQRSSPVQILSAGNNWVSVAAGYHHTLAIKSNGTLWAWGYNYYGQLGNRTSTNANTPTQVGTDTDWVSVAAGDYHTIAVKADGTVRAWGYNTYGQIGDWTTTNRNVPTWTDPDYTWASVAAGGEHSIAVKSDGTLWAWGYNIQGQLGDGTVSLKKSPMQIGTDTGWAFVAAGIEHTLGIQKTDGSLWAWGANDYGQLGDGTPFARTEPTQIGTDAWTLLAGGDYHTAALKSDGTLWTWGYNHNGQLGNGSTTNALSPVAIAGSSIWAFIAAGNAHTVGIKSDGTLWAWGYNYYGQIGNGLTTQQTSPVQIGADNRWIKTAAGQNHTAAVKSDGTLWAWGANSYGQVGDGSTAQKTSPVQIGTDIKWVTLAAGRNHTIAVKSDGTLWAWGDNQYGQLG